MTEFFTQDNNKIEKYIEILEAHLKEKTHEDKMENLVDLRRLYDDGFLGSAYADKADFTPTLQSIIHVHNVVITPKGALALIHWKKLLNEESFKFKFLQFIKTPIWIVFGYSLPHWSAILDWLKSIFS